MIQERIIAIIAELKNEPEIAETLSGTSDMLNDAGLDSLQLINFILLIEDEFGLEIDFDEFDMTHLESVDAFCRFIESQNALSR